MKNTFQEHLREVPSVYFTDVVLRKIEAVVEEKKEIKPLIGKSTWFLLGGVLLFLFIITLVSYEQTSVNKGMNNIYKYFNELFVNVTSYWFYVPLGLILIWEFVLRRRFTIMY